MMKKLIAMLLAVMMLLCSTAAYAEEKNELNWEPYTEDDKADAEQTPAEEEKTDEETPVEEEKADGKKTAVDSLVLNVEDTDVLLKDVKGEYVTLDPVGLKMFIPEEYKAIELNDEARQNGVIGYFVTEDEQKVIGINAYPNILVKEYKAQLLEKTELQIFDAVINGKTAILFEDAEKGVDWAVIQLEKGSLFLCVGPSDDMLGVLAATVQDAE